MIESDKSNQSRSNGRRSDASVSRRGFLKRLTAGGVMLAAPTFVSSSALGLGKAVAASERITVGAIGLGFHSRLNLPALARMPDVQCLAVCDCFAHRRAEGKARVDSLQGNNDCATYEDFRELIARDDIDKARI